MYLAMFCTLGLLCYGEVSMNFLLKSPSFSQEAMIPSKYTCEGKDISPPLSWENAPSSTKSFVLICDDPDAPRLWTHWLVYNIPASTLVFHENRPTIEKLPDGSLQGTNSFGNYGYGGPCPPSGTHRYFFKLFALDSTLDLQSGASQQDVEEAMEGHVLAKTELMGLYKKQQS